MKNRMVEVAKLVDRLVVVSPQPYFPLVDRFVERYRQRSRVPREDEIDGVKVLYPRFLSVPAVLKPLDPISLGVSVALTLLSHPELLDSDLLDVHTAYPDGLGGVLVARLLGKPSTITLRGHDINDVPAYPGRRVEAQLALRLADRIFSVCQALVDGAAALRVPREKCRVLPNGVDPTLFYPLDRVQCRRELGLPLDARIVLSVGYLVRRKGQHIITEAIGQLRREGMDDVVAVHVGGLGDEPGGQSEIEEVAERYGIRERVLFPGAIRQGDLVHWYNAADVLCLASDKEGWANVLLEALACGTPVVATGVWGTPEVIRSPDLGVLVERTVGSVRDGLREALTRSWDREVLVAFARDHTWEATARRVVEQFTEVIQGRAPAAERGRAGETVG